MKKQIKSFVGKQDEDSKETIICIPKKLNGKIVYMIKNKRILFNKETKTSYGILADDNKTVLDLDLESKKWFESKIKKKQSHDEHYNYELNQRNNAIDPLIQTIKQKTDINYFGEQNICVAFEGTSDYLPIYEYLYLTKVEVHELAVSFPFYEININKFESKNSIFACQVRIKYYFEPNGENATKSLDFYSNVIKYVLYHTEPHDFSPMRINLSVLLGYVGEDVMDNIGENFINDLKKDFEIRKGQIEKILSSQLLNDEPVLKSKISGLINYKFDDSYCKESLINRCVSIISDYKYLSFLRYLPEDEYLSAFFDNEDDDISKKFKALGLVWMSAHGIIAKTKIHEECWKTIFD